VPSKPRGSWRDFRLEGSLSPGTEAPGIRDRRWPAAASRAKASCTKETDADRATPTKKGVGMSPYAPAHPCGFPGCPMLVDSAHRRCEEHRNQEQKEINQRRGSASRRGYNARWRAARKHFLLNHPLCVECQKAGRITAATVVDHIIPQKVITSSSETRTTGRFSASDAMTARLPRLMAGGIDCSTITFDPSKMHWQAIWQRKTMGAAELTEEHGDELAPACKTLGGVIGAMLLNRLFEFQARE